jgi:two-component system cell cycle sensor histidine kinase/response regulator CckA
MSDPRADDAIIAGFESALAAIAALDVVRDPAGRIVDFVVLAVNPSAERLMQRPAAEVVGKSARTVPMLAGLRDTVAEFSAVVETGVPLVDEFRLDREGDREPCWVHRYVSRTRAGLIMAVRDISDDATLRRSGNHFFALSDDLWCVVDANNNYVRVNTAFERLLGWTEDQLIGTYGPALVHPDDMHLLGVRAERDEARMGSQTVELRVRHADGTYRRIVWSAVSIRGETHRLAVGRDVTEQRRAEEESQKRGALLEAILGGTSDVAFVKDREGRYLLMLGNDVVHGLPADQIIGRTDAEIAPAYAARRRASDLRVMATGLTEVYEYDHVVGGERRTLSVSKAPYRARDGTIIGTVGATRDLTEIRRLEAQVHQAQKMDAVGRLAGGIAHDFNNLLTAILSFATLAGETLAPDHPTQADLAAIRRAADGAAVLTRQMLAFSRRQLLEPRPLLLNDVVQNTERLLRSLVGEAVHIVMTLESELATITGDPSQIEQVLVNLVVNAGHAMPEGGTIWVETATVDVTAADAGRLPELPIGTYVRLTVRDTGIGMDEATRLHVFEPFFTTKPVGQGTGLGLASVYGIVQQSRGGVFVESQPGAGSEFAVYLPAGADLTPSPYPAPEGPRATIPRGSETVVLVEDNAIVRQAEERMLTEAGYRVFVASSGIEALGVVASLDGAIDLLITDLLMPEMGGRALVARLREDAPELRALLVSGYDPGEGDIVSLPPGTGFLHKPFTAAAFLSAVRALLDGRAVLHR